jgi:hypothetical protein
MTVNEFHGNHEVDDDDIKNWMGGMDIYESG